MNWLQLLTNGELDNLYHDCAGKLSYYNAAEGDSWYKEKAARGKAVRNLSVVIAEITDRDRVPPKGNYLI